MTFKSTPGNGYSYNNADSFAMAFDDAWKDYSSKKMNKNKSKDDKVEIILKQIENHPFLKDYPEKARQVAKFRLRLLDLD